MYIDHIFIFTDEPGLVADELVSFGLAEGSSRVHIGQGTTNRKFYFDNFFLEVLWVHNETEIRSEQVRPILLWQRAEFGKNKFSPFGLCIVNNSNSNLLFENSLTYQPSYFPEGMKINILTNEHQPSLPWTFRLPFKEQKKHEEEPTAHSNGINRLTKATFSYTHMCLDNYTDCFKDTESIVFSKSYEVGLTLTFDNNVQGLKKVFKKLKLTIEY